MKKLRIGIAGYGNIARGVEAAVKDSPDMELIAVFTRRRPEEVKIKSPGVKVVNFSQIEEYKDAIDVLVLCTGSAKDLPIHGVQFAKSLTRLTVMTTMHRFPNTLKASMKAPYPQAR